MRQKEHPTDWQKIQYNIAISRTFLKDQYVTDTPRYIKKFLCKLQQHKIP